MSKEKRYLQWGYDSFKDTKTGEISDNYIHLLNQQDQRISELEEQVQNLEELNVKFIEIGNEYAEKNKRLEEQLKNAIVPKFKIGQEVFIIFETTKKEYIVESTNINSITIFAGNELSYYCKYVDGERMYLELDESEIFATKEEAEVKLKELKGGVV